MGPPPWLVSDPIAHRGFYDDAAGAPENSLSAFRRAITHSIPFEFDVQYAADGCPVVWHDATISLPDGAVGTVGDLTSRELTKVRLGDSDLLPTLAEVLELVNGQVPIVIDVRRWNFDRHAHFERAIAAQLQHYRGPVALQSFDPLAVFRLVRLTTDLPVGQASGELHSVNRLLALIGRAMPTNIVTCPDFISYEITRLPSLWTDVWRRFGLPLLAYPVNNESDERRAQQVADNYFFGDYIPARYR